MRVSLRHTWVLPGHSVKIATPEFVPPQGSTLGRPRYSSLSWSCCQVFAEWESPTVILAICRSPHLGRPHCRSRLYAVFFIPLASVVHSTRRLGSAILFDSVENPGLNITGGPDPILRPRPCLPNHPRRSSAFIDLHRKASTTTVIPLLEFHTE